MPQVCEGCTAKTKVKLLAERGAFFVTPRSGLAGASSLMLFLLQAHYKSGSGQVRAGRGLLPIAFLIQTQYESASGELPAGRGLFSIASLLQIHYKSCSGELWAGRGIFSIVFS